MWVAIIMGMTTGAVGGVIRDIFINEVPLIFRKDIYAIACILGGLIYYTCDSLVVGHITTPVSYTHLSMIVVKSIFIFLLFFEPAKLIIKEYHWICILMFYSMIIKFINLFYTHSSFFTSPSTASTIFLIGMLREAISLAFKAICKRPPQQGTSMMSTCLLYTSRCV